MHRLLEVIDLGQQHDPFAPVTVIVPSPYARVQLRREVGLRRGLCNVAFNTWGEVLVDLARLAGGLGIRVPNQRTLNEALRQTLRSASGAFQALARSPIARNELVGLFSELWRADRSLRRTLWEQGGRARALVEALGALEDYLSDHGFTDLGRVHDLASAGAQDVSVTFVRWFPRDDHTRERALVDVLAHRGLLLGTIGLEPDEELGLGAAVACADPDEEVRAALRRALNAAEEGIALWRQAIVHPPTPRYRRILHQQLAVAGVPVAGRASLTLAQSATGRTLLGALTLAEEGWRRETVVSWITSAPVTDGVDGLRVPAEAWDEVSGRAGVVEGLAQWRSRLARFATGGRQLDPHVAHSPSEVRSATSLAAFVERLAEDLTPRCRRWSEWSRWASAVLDRYLDPVDRAEKWPRSELLAAQMVREMLAELGALDAVGADADLPAFRHAVGDELAARPVRDDLELAQPPSESGATNELGDELEGDSVGLGGPVGSGIFVGTPAEARGLAFDAVVVVGLADEQLPGGVGGGSLPIGAEPGHDDWPTRGRAATEVLDDIRTTVALTGRSALGTWPAVDPRTGRAHVRSRWLEAGEPLAPAAEREVTSFAAGLLSPAAKSTPVTGAERVLVELAAAVRSGWLLESHPAVGRDPATASGPFFADAVASARSAVSGAFSRFEGNVGGVGDARVGDELSPTRLEEYATCPRRYLFARELGLRPPHRPEATEQMEARDRGTLVHEILARYVGERIELDRPPSLGRLLEIAKERFDLAEQEGRCGPPVIAAVERSLLLREMSRFFDEDLLEPVAVELAFGNVGARHDVPGDRLVALDPEEAQHRGAAVGVAVHDGRSVRFGGWVDRIDRAPDGTVVVSDYKTGRQAELLSRLAPDPVAAGTKLQLPIYALAARAYLQWEGEVRARYWLTSSNRSHVSIECTLDDRLAARLSEVVSLITRGVEAGVFPAVPGAETYRPEGPRFEHCISCAFDRMCPADRDRRWAVQIESPEVAPLVALAADLDPELRDKITSKDLWGSQ